MKRGDVKNLVRLHQINLILFEQGFGFILNKIKLSKLMPFNKRLFCKVKLKKHISDEVRLRLTLEKLGPTFIKLGQLLSVRPDLIPLSYVTELSKLQDHVPAVPYQDIRQVIEEELGKPIEKLFASFDRNPIASASVAQVHKAKLHNGEIVAVKVQRPNIDRVMKQDIELLFFIARELEKHFQNLRIYRPIAIVKEFSAWTQKELDFRFEASNAKIFKKNFKANKNVKIPNIYLTYSCKKILTMEYIDGISLHDVRELKKTRINIQKALDIGFDAFLTQVFDYGIFHGDPHPGNIIVLKDGSIALIDFGIVGKFNVNMKKSAQELLFGVIDSDYESVTKTLLRMSRTKRPSNLPELKQELKEVIEPMRNADLSEIRLSKVMEQALDIALRHKIKIPTDFALFGKTLVTLEGIGLRYDPKFRLIDSAKPFIEKLISEKGVSGIMVDKTLREIKRFTDSVAKVPEEINRALRTVQEGKVKVDIEDKDVKKLSKEIDRSSNRMSYGMIIAALIISGALVINSGTPILLGMPILSLLLYLGAGIIGALLIISILREVK
ncbi:MAG: AarF/ABC1/UbiB kinase family protein [Nanoarchaeota archaeon]|nr:AarF/ABC1/UbiB kinase family protein [Nanoarchaeota archaeon]MBU1704016.1 AarF/ABC1/UbiB kinase family protein [Nanoarchaeota archaeon]